jgi:hypothetical protein
MASRFILPGPSPIWNNLTYFYNVDGHVGPIFISGPSDSPSIKVTNPFDDVQLVQFFLNSVGEPKIAPLPSPTGTFDVQTGFWIYHMQSLSFSTVDGVVSPATGRDGTYQNKFYFIFNLNILFQAKFGQTAFDDIPNRPELGPSLRAAISP